MGSLITGLHHASLKCAPEQLEEVVGFYHGLLGLPIVREWDADGAKALMFDTGAGLIEVFANAKDAPGQGAVRHFALATGDVDRCAAIVEGAGYEVFVRPKDIVIPSDPPLPARIAFCSGPVGEHIEFFQEICGTSCAAQTFGQGK